VRFGANIANVGAAGAVPVLRVQILKKNPLDPALMLMLFLQSEEGRVQISVKIATMTPYVYGKTKKTLFDQ
jgi:hypothetical protein